uniref:Uncharacterized protein n=1 Tax=Utricularia reniformis TaxID=192314 RepID=A0A1Y0AZP3_9LAMI|nr:hypothetical protein AEK19_MT0380 [Utricularia reniformis]ART30652.1 hypothetical protein AEK19_MT0380 [Utricularia reniformis]
MRNRKSFFLELHHSRFSSAQKRSISPTQARQLTHEWMVSSAQSVLPTLSQYARLLRILLLVICLKVVYK